MKKKKVVKARTALENLMQADALLSAKGRWIQGNEALDLDGFVVRTNSPKAFAFCAFGAVKHIDGPGEQRAIHILGEAAKSALKRLKYSDLDGLYTPEDFITNLNDNYKHSDVRKMFRRAIKLAKEERYA